MARKPRPKVQKRPTQAQIKRSQKRIIGYLAKSNQPIDVVASSTFRVSKQQLEKFLFQPRAKTRRGYNRSEAYSRIYKTAGRVGPIGEVKRVPRVRVFRQVEKATGDIQYTARIRGVSDAGRRRTTYLVRSIELEYKIPQAESTLNWQMYASEHNIPTSLEGIRHMYNEGEISRSSLRKFLAAWYAIYEIDDDYYGDTLDSFDMEDDFE